MVSRIAIIGIKGKVAFTLNEVDRGLSDHNFKKMTLTGCTDDVFKILNPVFIVGDFRISGGGIFFYEFSENRSFVQEYG